MTLRLIQEYLQGEDDFDLTEKYDIVLTLYIGGLESLLEVAKQQRISIKGVSQWYFQGYNYGNNDIRTIKKILKILLKYGDRITFVRDIEREYVMLRGNMLDSVLVLNKNLTEGLKLAEWLMEINSKARIADQTTLEYILIDYFEISPSYMTVINGATDVNNKYLFDILDRVSSPRKVKNALITLNETSPLVYSEHQSSVNYVIQRYNLELDN